MLRKSERSFFFKSYIIRKVQIRLYWDKYTRSILEKLQISLQVLWHGCSLLLFMEQSKVSNYFSLKHCLQKKVTIDQRAPNWLNRNRWEIKMINWNISKQVALWNCHHEFDIGNSESKNDEADANWITERWLRQRRGRNKYKI